MDTETRYIPTEVWDRRDIMVKVAYTTHRKLFNLTAPDWENAGAEVRLKWRQAINDGMRAVETSLHWEQL